jgi:hypothetical protein
MDKEKMYEGQDDQLRVSYWMLVFVRNLILEMNENKNNNIKYISEVNH